MQPAKDLTGADAIAALADDSFEVTPHLAFTASLAHRLGLDLSATLAVMRHMPLWATMDGHAALRRDVASFLSNDRRGKSKRAARRIRLVLDAGLAQNDGVIDLLGLVREITHLYMAEVTGLTLPLGNSADLPNIFSSNLGVAARLRLEQRLRQMIGEARTSHPEDTESSHVIRIGQWMMGRDPLIGTLTQTFYHHLTLLNQSPLSDHPLSQVPSHTGVPMIGRVATLDRTFNRLTIPAGTLAKCHLDSFNAGTESDRLRFFGAGEHLCLGRPQALDLFSIVASAVNSCEFGLRILSFRRKADDVFDVPAEFTVCKIPARSTASHGVSSWM